MKLNNGHKQETDRVRANTTPELNERIDENIRQKLIYYAGRKQEIPARIEELDHEWDVERLLETNASALALGGLVLGMTVNKKWLFIPSVILPFLFLHGVQGWCPPLPVLRQLGVRTQREIDSEKYALKYMRGDFETLREAIEEAQRAIETFKSTTH